MKQKSFHHSSQKDSEDSRVNLLLEKSTGTNSKDLASPYFNSKKPSSFISIDRLNTYLPFEQKTKAFHRRNIY
jgi:hypothetical protein